MIKSSIVFLMLILAQSAYAFPVYTGGGFSPGILEKTDCSKMQRYQQLSRNPLNKELATTHADRQYMIQYKMFKCVPEGIHELDRLLDANKDIIGPDKYALGKQRLSKTPRQREDDVRGRADRVDDFIDFAKLFGEECVDEDGELICKLDREQKAILRTERRKIRDILRGRTTDGDPANTDDIPRAMNIIGLDARFASTFGAVKYMGQLRLTLFEGGKQKYNPADNSYPWIWPKHAIVAEEEAADDAFGGVKNIGTKYFPAISDEPVDMAIVKMLTPNKKTDGQGAGQAPEDQEIKDQSVFYATPIEPVFGNPNDPNHRVDNWNSFIENYELFLSAETPEEKEKYRLLCIARMLTEIRYLRREFSVALVCKYKNGNECPEYRSLAEISQATKNTLEARELLSFPMMAPFTVKIHKSNESKICETMQRADRAHAQWARAVRNGHLPREFRNAWTSMFAHSVIMANQALPWPLDFDRDGLEQALPFVNVIQAKVDRKFPGEINGKCEFGPLELNVDDLDPEDEK
jgi:hypothetical protein